jgi:hypothetical protein
MPASGATPRRRWPPWLGFAVVFGLFVSDQVWQWMPRTGALNDRMYALVATALFVGGVLVLLLVLGIRHVHRLGIRNERLRKGQCAWCGYERAQLDKGAACPECGRTPPRPGA